MEDRREIWDGFIAIEGIDGAGTTTLLHNMEQYYTGRNIAVRTGCEPTGGPIGTLIRRGLSGKENLSHDALAMLFAADRCEHLYGEGGIRQALDNSQLYLTDRYLFSSLAYQSIHSDRDFVFDLNKSFPLPSVLIYLKLPVDEAMRRIAGRPDRDIFETTRFQQQVAESYRRSMDAFGKSSMRVLELDSTRSPEEVLEKAVDFLSVFNAELGPNHFV